MTRHRWVWRLAALSSSNSTFKLTERTLSRKSDSVARQLNLLALDGKLNSTLIIVAAILFIPGIIQMGWIHVLNNRRSWSLLTLIACLLAAMSLVLYLQRLVGLPIALALAAPIYHLLLFRLFYRLFVQRQHRDPKNCALVWTSGLAIDRFFSITYLLVASLSATCAIGFAH